MFQIRAKLSFNKKVKDNYFRLALEAQRIARESRPGQFVNMRVNDGCRPLLRRPFSIHRVRGSSIEILYEVLGEGTEILSHQRPGEYLDVIGPLGNGFDFQSSVVSRQSSVLVAGGMGIAPLLFLAEQLKTYDLPLITVLIGARTKKQILCEKEFKKLGCDVKIATDDGSKGFKGKVTELLREILVTGHRSQVTGRKHATCDMEHATIYACGPRPMLQEISRISKRYHIPTQGSLEEHMACGIGACLGCVVNTVNGYQRVCKEGPVFDVKEITW